MNKIIVGQDHLILKKKLGQTTIPKTDLINVAKMGYSNVTMTYGSKGVFGFLGTTMDEAVSMVKDRKKMVKIVTKYRSYIISADRPDALVADIIRTYKLDLIGARPEFSKLTP